MSAIVKRSTTTGFESFTLDNSRIRVAVIPALGGRVWELDDLRRRRQWIWHREDVELAASPAGARYDDVWAGGWEELFPNDAPGVFDGRDLPDHGEWWTTAWHVDETSSGDEAVLRLVAETRTIRATCVKEFRLASDSETVRVSYRIESREPATAHFLFKQHLPVAITPSCRLVLPDGRVTAVEPGFGTLLPGPGPFDWPIARGPGHTSCDLREMPSRADQAREFVYVADTSDGWCGVDDTEQGASLRLMYDRRQIPYVWLFLSYGGWRNCYTAVLEPCTNLPKDLSEAVRRGQSAVLAPGRPFETQVAVTLGGLVAPRT